MGLDVYLRRYDDFEGFEKKQKEYEVRAEANWQKVQAGREYKDLSEAEKTHVRGVNKELAKELGCSKDGEPGGVKNIELPSAKYPEHMFKIGYLRSSYNEGGVDAVVGNATGRQLSWIFDAGNKYKFQPNWKQAKKRCAEVLTAFSKFAKESPYQVTDCAYNEFMGDPQSHKIDSEEKALAAFLETEKRERSGDGGSFSNRDGHFFLKEPLPVVGLISGVQKRFFVEQRLPCAYIIYRSTDLKWYEEALEITIEMIEWVLNQEDQDKYWLHWSS